LLLAVSILAGGFIVGASTPRDGMTSGSAGAVTPMGSEVPDSGIPRPTDAHPADTGTSIAPRDETPHVAPTEGPRPGLVSPAPAPQGPVSVPEPPALLAPASLDLEDGVYEGSFELRNIGGTSLTWGHSAPPALTISPGEGTIPPGGAVEVLVSFDWTAHPIKHWSQVVSIASTGGPASIEVTGTTLLPPVLKITGGNYASVDDLTFQFAPGLVPGEIVFKNDGDLLLTADLEAAGLTLSQSELGLSGGGETALHMSPCGLPPLPPNVPFLPIVRTIQMHTNTWQGDVELHVVFIQVANQWFVPC
jgi:hypothetical protein